MGRGMVERNQRIGLRVVGRSIADRRRICHHQKVFCPPFLQTALAVGPLRHQVDTVTRRQTERFDVGRVDEHHPASALHAAISVVEPVDRGVVLVMAA